MRTADLALVQGIADTKATLAAWNRRPGPVLAAWLAGAAAITLLLLVAVWVVATIATPDPTRLAYPGVTRPATLGDFGHVLVRNGLVLALHALACVAGFIAGSSLPVQAERHTGLWRTVHERAGPLAIAFVGAATAFSLATQAYVLGTSLATLSAQWTLTPLQLLALLTPHALLELMALFLPLAAWLLASRRGAWQELLAATAVTVAISVPTLLLAAAVESFVTPRLILAVLNG